MDNFSFRTLEHLARHDVESNAAGIFRRKRNNAVPPSEYMCFPWLIVEHKKKGGSAHVEKCYCQAANAGTAAVMMLETLAGVVPGVEEKQQEAIEHIPPVVTITTVDSIVRVWITHASGPCEDDAEKMKYVGCPFSGFPSPANLFLPGRLLTHLCQGNGLHLERGHDVHLGRHQVPSHSREHPHLGHA
jgi:hypothetical protein